MASKRLLLPTLLRPYNYQLELTPNFDKFTFEGKEVITLNLAEKNVSSFDKITLHSLDIDIDQSSVEVKRRGNMDVLARARSITYDASDAQTATIHLDKSVSTMENDQYLLAMRFMGILNDKMCGFYRSQYSDPKTGQKKWMATTQFEAADARRAFPCFDEPALKATFDVTLIVPKHMDAISCMPIVSQEDLPNDLKRVTYGQTPIMSTYLLAFVIGEFDYIEATSKHSKLVRVYTPKGKSKLGEFALQVAVQSLDFFTDLFEFDYPIPKMDLLAIPDFASGAMENYGCITYRETRLLIDPKESSEATKQATARTIAHEVSHMWFGNLVSPEWWKYLWLKEGFARFLEFYSVNTLFPDWNLWLQFVQQVFGMAQNLDCLRSSHPVEVEVIHPGELAEIFDSISYAKGGSLNRMLNNWIGDDHMRKGLQQYIKKFAYKNTVTEDLWESLEQASGKPVKEVMDTFVKQTGYPVLIVDDKPVEAGIELSIRQTRFLIDGTTDGTLWQIPIRITAGKPTYFEEESEGHALILMKDRSLKCVLKNLNDNDWIKINSGQAGFYRVQYSQSMLKKLAKAIRDKELTDPSDRIGVLSDLFALAKAGYRNVSDCFSLIESYKEEEEYSVWAEISDNIDSVDIMLRDEELGPMLDNFKRSVFKHLFPRFGWQAKANEGHLDALFRELVIEKLLGAKDPELTSQAKTLFERYIDGKEHIAPDLRYLVYKSIVQNGGEEEYNKVLKIYENADSQEEKIRALRALCSTRDSRLIEETIRYIWSDKVRKQDIFYPLNSLAINTKGRQASWNYVRENWEKIYDSYGAGHIILGNILSSSAGYFVTEEKAEELQQFFTKYQAQNRVKGIERAYQQTLERIRYKIKFVSREKEHISQWLSQNYKTSL